MQRINQTQTTYIIDLDNVSKRLDVYLAEMSQVTRSHIKMLVENGDILLNGQPVKKTGVSLRLNDEIIMINSEPQPLSLEPEDIQIDIVYEDEHLAVINKPRGLVVHPAQGSESGTLVNALLYKLDNLSGINGVIRPGIVHRIDKDTTGLLVVAKNDVAHVDLSTQIATKTCKRQYIALVDGVIKRDIGTIDAPIARMRNDRKKMIVDPMGKEAITDFEVVKRYPRYTLVKFNLHTGRTHQIRVHSKYIGHPIVGDKAYNKNTDKFNLSGQLLHAETLQFIHPITREEMKFFAPIPDDFRHVLEMLDKEINI